MPAKSPPPGQCFVPLCLQSVSPYYCQSIRQPNRSKMHQLIFLGLLVMVVQLQATTTTTNDEYCHANVKHKFCTSASSGEFSCSAKYSGAHHVMNDLQSYVNHHLVDSYEYLMMSANYASYKNQREGFAKMFKKFSDETWEHAVELVKYITKRGGSFDSLSPLTIKSEAMEFTEPESVSKSLDMYKKLAQKAHEIHGQVTKLTHRKPEIHDSDVISFIENVFVGKHSSVIRDLAGHSNDLLNLIKTSDSKQTGLSIYMFDDYLKSVY